MFQRCEVRDERDDAGGRRRPDRAAGQVRLGGGEGADEQIDGEQRPRQSSSDRRRCLPQSFIRDRL